MPKREPTIIGFDLALTVGFGLLTPGGDCVAFGNWSNKAPFEGRKKEDKLLRPQIRFRIMADQLREQLDLWPSLTHVAYEHVSPHGSVGGNQMQLFGGWRALLLAEADRRGLRVWPVGNSTLRSVACNGSEPPEVAKIPRRQRANRRDAWKAAVIRRALEKWNVHTTDDEADALWVAESARQGRGGP